MRLAISALITIGGLVAAGPALADPAAAARGKAVVDQWCRECHLRANDKPNPDMAPRYEDIVRRTGRDEAYFRKFLSTDHFPMTIYRLFEDEKRDVVAYLMSLKKR
ncbi:c-type cytochrome [Kaistia adipata]|uniref:c-type cytochrome n=1 Tax=Kaistia adipata TaxID=166954 RepID=UPI0004142D6A|nr:c-type cytochrome [Kaistia adipata]